MRHLFIVNPVAGGNKTKVEETLRQIRTAASQQTEPFDIYITTSPMDAAEKIRLEARSGEILRVYACGGDGTLNECVNGAAGHTHVAVTHFPTGTGNDFVRMFGKEDALLFRDITRLMKGTVKPLDVIETHTPDGLRYGLSICSVGVDARIGTDVHKYSAIPIIGGATGYVVSLIVNLIRGVNQDLTIITETGTLTGSFALLCACNGRYYGGGFNPVPEAMPDDGLLDFLIVTAVTRLKFLRVIVKYAKGYYRDISDIITHIRGKTITVKSNTSLAVNIDGELIHAENISFSVIPGFVNFIIPEGQHFFSSNYLSEAVIKSNHEI